VSSPEQFNSNTHTQFRIALSLPCCATVPYQAVIAEMMCAITPSAAGITRRIAIVRRSAGSRRWIPVVEVQPQDVARVPWTARVRIHRPSSAVAVEQQSLQWGKEVHGTDDTLRGRCSRRSRGPSPRAERASGQVAIFLPVRLWFSLSLFIHSFMAY
jgi:hypothetical protein